MAARPKIPTGQLIGYLSIFVTAPIFTYLTGSWLDKLLGLPPFPPFPVNVATGLLVFAFGLSVGIRSTKVLYREGLGLPWGEARKTVQTRRLVTSGPYAYSRNPMILGYSLLPCGMGVMFRSLGMSTVIPLIVVVINVAVVKIWEEPDLERRFAQEYLDYKESTPFLIPRARNLSRIVLEALPRPPEEGSG